MLDMETILINTLIIIAGSCLFMFILWHQNKKRFPELSWLFFYHFALFLSIALRLSGNYLLPFFSIIISNGSLVFGAIILLIGLEKILHHFLAEPSKYFW